MATHPNHNTTHLAFVLAIERLEHEAHAMGFLRTAHALNEAKNKAGWEIAERLGAGKNGK